MLALLCYPTWANDRSREERKNDGLLLPPDLDFHWTKLFGIKDIIWPIGWHIDWDEKNGSWRSCQWNIWITLFTGASAHSVEILCRKMLVIKSEELLGFPWISWLRSISTKSVLHRHTKAMCETSNLQDTVPYRSLQLGNLKVLRRSITCWLFHTKWTNVSIAAF